MLSLILSFAGLLAGAAFASLHSGPGGLSKYIVAAADTPAGLAGAEDGNGSVAAGPTANSTEPCAQVSQLVAAHAALGPDGHAQAEVDPTLAFECLRSVPLDLLGNKQQLLGVRTFVGFQSTHDLLEDPIEGYVMPGVDIIAGLDKLTEALNNGTYDQEYDFQFDLLTLIYSAHDQHFKYIPDITQIFAFTRDQALFSLSTDRTAPHQIYSNLDVSALAFGNGTNYTASPIVKIDNQLVENFLRAYAYTNSEAQDLDAAYNTVLYNGASTASGNLFGASAYYQGNETVYEYKNGTVHHAKNVAVTTSDFSGVVDGKTFFDKFCVGKPRIPLSPRNVTYGTLPVDGPNGTFPVDGPALPPPVSTPVPFTAVSQQTSAPAPRNFPEPWIISDDAHVACYFPEGQADTAILSIPSFDSEAYLDQLSFQNTVRSCLATAAAKQKQRLVIDLRGNVGGVVLLAFDMFEQLFPSLTPYGGTNFRASPLFDDIGQVVTDAYADVGHSNRPADNDSSVYTSIFNANDGLDGHILEYDSWAEFYGPVVAHGAKFTHLLRFNLSNSHQLGPSSPGVDGYGNLTNFVPKRIFAAENIVLLQDGLCASTCAVFSEFMKSQGHVKSVVMGGRWQTGPMQAVGGVKGANIYPMGYLQGPVTQAFGLADAETRAGLQEKYAVEIQTFPAAVRRAAKDGYGDPTASVNSRNNIRQGDESLTPLQFV